MNQAPPVVVMLIDNKMRWRPWEIPPELLGMEAKALSDGHFWFLVRLGGPK